MSRIAEALPITPSTAWREAREARRVDLEHLGTKGAEHPGARWPCDDPGEVQHPDARRRQRRGGGKSRRVVGQPLDGH